MKILKKTITYLLLAVILLPLACIMAVQAPSVQTFVAQKFTESLSKDIEGSISVGKVTILSLHTAIVSNFCITDTQGDTILHAGTLSANLSGKTLFGKDELKIKRVSLSDGQISIKYITPEETNVSRLLSQFKSDSDKGKGGIPWMIISLGRLKIKDMTLSIDNPFAEAKAGIVDINHLNVMDFSMDAGDLSWTPSEEDGAFGKAEARIRSLSFDEKGSGLRLENLKAAIALSDDGISVRNLCLNDGKSELMADCELQTSAFADFSNFTDSVPLELKFINSKISLASAASFVPALAGKDMNISLDGDIGGTISCLNIGGLEIRSGSDATILNLNGTVDGLPDTRRMRADIHINDSRTTLEDIASIIRKFNDRFDESDITKYAPGETFTLNGIVKGSLSDLMARLDLGSVGSGKLSTNLNCKDLTSRNPIIKGRLDGEGLTVGKFLKDTTMGNLTFSGVINADLGKPATISLEGLNIDNFSFKGYEYSDIIAAGAIEGSRISALISSSDPNFNLYGDISADLSDKTRRYYNADLDIKRADLSALKLDKRDTCMLKGHVNAEIAQLDGAVFLGNATVNGLSVKLPGGTQNLGDIALKAFFDQNEEYNVELKSSLADASYCGSSSFKELAQDAKSLLSRELGNLLKIEGCANPQRAESDYSCRFSMKTGCMEPLTAFIMSDLHLSSGTTIEAMLEGCRSISIDAQSKLIQLGSNTISGFKLKALSDNGPINADISADAIRLGEIILRNNTISAGIEDNRIDVRLKFDNSGKENRNGLMQATLTFPDRDNDPDILQADILPSHIMVEGYEWNIARADIKYRKKHIDVKGFKAYCGEQYLMADGCISESRSDTLKVGLNKLDLKDISQIINLPLDIKGVFTGKAAGFGLLSKEMGLLTDLDGNGLAINGEGLGKLHLLCKWDETKQRFNILVDNSLGKRKPINAIGWFKPMDKSLDAKASIDSLSVSWLTPFLTGIVSDMGGSISGGIQVSGYPDKLKIISDGTRFNDMSCKVDFTNVPYTISGPFSVSDKGVTFDNDTISDKLGNTGRIGGGISYDNFKDIRLGVNFRLRNMLALNTNESFEDNGFYGRAFGTGTVNIDGTLQNINLGINLLTGAGSVHIPLTSSGTEKTSILTFTDNNLPEIDSATVISGGKANSQSSLGVNVKLNITQDTEVGLDINRSLGDMLKAKGTGNVEIRVGPGLFDIKGGYNINEGSYKLALMGITSKDFIINPGGTINFNGDIMQSDLNMTATYRTKASIGQLIADTTSVSTRRIVNCGIGISGKLSNPQLAFDIDIPDLDPATQNRVTSALSTEDKRLKQLLALLVSGSFVPDEQSGIVNNTTVLYSNASEIMANQVNNIFRQLDIPLDLGFNYQPGSGGVDIFDVAISTQLFNNRVTINGNIGNQDYLTTSSNSEVVGNVDMEVKLDNSGRLRLNLFSHAADRYSNYLDQTQRNGAGIVYQEEFDTFKEFWAKLFRRTHSLIPGVTLPAPTFSPAATGRPVPLRDSSNTISIKPAR